MRIRVAVSSLFVAVSLFAALYSINQVSALPNGRRSIGRLPIERGEPLRIRAVKVKGTRIKRNQKFAADDDWIKTLTITVRNVSSKRIVFASIDLIFAPPPGSDVRTVDEIGYGERSLITRRGSAEELQSGIAPNQDVDIGLSARDYERIRALLTFVGYTTTPRIDLKIGRIIFADDSSWYGGNFQRDPIDPKGWINTELTTQNRSQFKLRQPLEATRLDSRVSRNGSMFAWDTAINSSAFPELSRFLSPVSYTPQQSSGCYNKAWTGRITCSWGMQCDTKRELSDTQPGGYIFENVSAICEDVLEDYCGQGLTTIAIPCSFSGGGGGGKGGGYDGNGSCYTDWDCDSGYSCGDSGSCEEDEDWIS